jgi:hypothetical protein
MGIFTADAGVALMQVLRGRDQATAWGGFALLSSTTYRCQLLSEQLESLTENKQLVFLNSPERLRCELRNSVC